jgi:hypothetical protein
MSDIPSADHDTLPPSVAQRVDEACDRFEVRWKAATDTAAPPRLEEDLGEASAPEHGSLLRHLIELDVYCRRLRGEVPHPDDYLSRFPMLDTATLSRVLSSGSTPPAPVAPEHDPAATGPHSTTPSARRFRCPHCHNPLQLADERSDEVLCPACGSSFRVQDTQQTSTTSGMRQLGKFQLLERVGLGAFGAVWRARDTELHRQVALKVPHASLLAESRDRERFHREARAAAQLHHRASSPSTRWRPWRNCQRLSPTSSRG